MPERTSQETRTTNGEAQTTAQTTAVTRTGTATEGPKRQVTSAGQRLSTSTQGEQVSVEAHPIKRSTTTQQPGGGTRVTTNEDHIMTVSFGIHVRSWCDC